MASAPSNPNAPQPQAAYAPPSGPPSSHPSPLPTGTPIPSSAPDSQRGEASPLPVQQAYSPPPGGAYPQYSPHVPPGYPQVYPGAHGYPGYGPGVPGYPPPVGQYPPAFGHYPPPPGQYSFPSGQYPPPTGQYPSTGAPTEGQYPASVGVPPVGQYPGSPPAGNYLPSGAPPGYQMPIADPNFPGVGAIAAPSYYQPGYYPAPPVSNQPSYLGSPIPDPHAPAAHHGVQKVPGYDPALTYDAIAKVIHSGHDAQLSGILLALDVFKMDALCDYTISKTGQSLQDLIEKHSHEGSSFRHALRALTLGPLGFDVELAHKALAGFGTNETLLTELIMGRSGVEIRLLIEGYRIKYGKDLVSVVKGDLSGKTERMFMMALNGQRPPDHLPVDRTEVEADIETLHHASKKKEEIPFFEILINRSNPHIAAVVAGFSMRYKNLSTVIKKTFSGHIQSSLLYIMHGAKSKRDGRGFWRDAKLLEKSMAGLGTRDTQLTYRLIRAHWDPHRLEAIKDAYRRRYGRSLEARVKGETSGDYQKLLVAIVKSSETRRV